MLQKCQSAEGFEMRQKSDMARKETVFREKAVKLAEANDIVSLGVRHY